MIVLGDQNQMGGCGFILRNSDAACVFCGCKRSKGSNGLLCKVWVIKEGMQKALDLGIAHLIVESDSKVIIDTILNHSTPPWSIAVVRQNIHTLTTRFLDCSFVHTWREGICSVNWCVDLARNSSLDCNGQVDLRPDLDFLVCSDRNGNGCIRLV